MISVITCFPPYYIHHTLVETHQHVQSVQTSSCVQGETSCRAALCTSEVQNEHQSAQKVSLKHEPDVLKML